MKISVVVSAYNEEGNVGPMCDALAAQLPAGEFEAIFVNDGSSDLTLPRLRAAAALHPFVKVISFSRNFGHEAAMIAGIDHAVGDVVVCMDCDLQHPPAELPRMVASFHEGADVVLMAREDTDGAGVVKKGLSSLFYKILNRASDFEFVENASDFFLISRRVAEVVRKDFRERTRYLRGYIQCSGFTQVTLNYKAAVRNSGVSKYSIRRLVVFSIDTLANFSSLPLRLAFFFAIKLSVAASVLGGYTLYRYSVGTPPTGYTTIVMLVLALFAFNFVFLGIIGLYISKLYDEVKARPIYLVSETLGL